jgi:hypothetical protein
MMDIILNSAIAQFLMKKKGDALSVCTSRISLNGDASVLHAFRIWEKGDAQRVSLLPKRTINRIFTKGWFLHQQEAFPLVFF